MIVDHGRPVVVKVIDCICHSANLRDLLEPYKKVLILATPPDISLVIPASYTVVCQPDPHRTADA